MEFSLGTLSLIKPVRRAYFCMLNLSGEALEFSKKLAVAKHAVKACGTASLALIMSFSLLSTDLRAENANNKAEGRKDTLSRIWDSVEIKGFGTLGYSNAGKYEDRTFRRNVYQDGMRLRDNGFLVDSRVGMQITGELNNHWDFMLLGVYKEQFGDDFIDYIDAAFVRYNSAENWQVTIGRQPFDMFFLSDHRNVGYSYDWVRPPTEFYGFIPYDSFDGVKFSKNWGDFDNEWSWNFSVGLIKEKFENKAFEDDRPDVEDVSEARPIYNTELTWRRANWSFRANYAFLKFKQDLDDSEFIEELVWTLEDYWPELPDLAEKFLVNNILRYLSVGAQWEKDDWKVQTELSKIDANFIHYNGWRGYFHVSKRFGDFMPYATYGFARDDSRHPFRRVSELDLPDDPELRSIILTVQRGMDVSIRSVRQNQRSLALGVRWDFAAQKAVKFQCDQYWFDKKSGSIHGRIKKAPDNDDTRSWCSLTFDWVF